MRRLNNEELSYMHMWGWLARGVFELAISEKKSTHACMQYMDTKSARVA